MKFNSKRLQSCIDLTKPVLDKIHEIKDSISEDIKQLEKYFKTTNISESFQYIISDPWSVSNVACKLDRFGQGDGIATEEYLKWDHEIKRLIYVRKEYDASVNLSLPDKEAELIGYVHFNKSHPINSINKPLIETSFDVRKRMFEHNHIEEFLFAIAKRYDVMNEIKHTFPNGNTNT